MRPRRGWRSSPRRTGRQQILAQLARLEELASLRRTTSGLVIGTPENLADLLGMPEPPTRVWWEKAEMELCLVPAGEFSMGSARSDRSARDNERPQHQVHLDAFYIGRYPVTQAQYARFVQARGYRVPFYETDWTKPYNWDLGEKTPPPGRLDHPVVLVNWDDAVAFCRWAGLRLPSEAEWEKAARGTDGRIYPGETRGTRPCATRMRARKGARRRSGRTARTATARMAAPTWPATPGSGARIGTTRATMPAPPGATRRDRRQADTRVLRGGSWNYVSGYQRAAHRNSNYPDFRDYLGFRCGVSTSAD